MKTETWYVGNVAGGHGKQAVSEATGKTIAHVYDADDTCEFIVTACNAHNELVAALRWIVDHGDTGEGNRPAYHAMRARARAALAEAEAV